MSRKRKSLFKTLTAIACIAGLSCGICAMPIGAESAFNYNVLSDASGASYVEITGCSNALVNAEVPAEIDGIAVKSIGDRAFSWCEKLKKVVIPDGVTFIGESAFESCTALEAVTIPEGVTQFGNYAFYDCTSLTDINIPKSLTSIGNYAFENCVKLTGAELPAGVSELGHGVFNSCISLEAINVADGNAVYRSEGGMLLSKDSTVLIAYPAGAKSESLEIPEGVSEIGFGAFLNCDNLKSISIGGNVRTIGASAFSQCDGLVSIDILSGVEVIGEGAFSKCGSLESFIIRNPQCNIYDAKSTVSNSYSVEGGYSYNGDIFSYEGSLAESYCTFYGKSFIPIKTIATENPDITIESLGELYSTNDKIHFGKRLSVLKNGAEAEYTASQVSADIVGMQDVNILVNGEKAASVQAELRYRGDVNGDNKITALDASVIFSAYKSYYRGDSYGLDPKSKYFADCDENGKISALDASYAFSVYKENYRKGDK